MDWARDNTGVSEQDFENVFKYEPKETTAVVCMAGQTLKNPTVFSLKDSSDWYRWLDEEVPSPVNSGPGLVLVLAKRVGEQEFGIVQRINSDKWLERIDSHGQARSRAEKVAKLATLAKHPSLSPSEKPSDMGKSTTDTNTSILSGGSRSLRTLPFSKDVFRAMTQKFYTHGTIARAISRSDIPVFAADQVEMQGPEGKRYPTYVYHCRTTHAWKMDLALTATYLPHCGLTYAVMFGCPVETEEEVIKRLSLATAEICHPLVMPGIFAEIERNRHVYVVEETISQLETCILELDFGPQVMEGQRDPEAESKNENKREAWLDTTYLCNGLISWNTQLKKMACHVDELQDNVFGDRQEYDAERLNYHKQMRRAGAKVRSRTLDLIEEYDDKIRDCQMRVDGMAMATQWSHRESNFEIALATGRDSRQMRSLALLTMVFLPGTFFATVFSMTFFNWADLQNPSVSPYIWIYVVITTLFTLVTVGSWYYFVVHRSREDNMAGDEENLPSLTSS